MVSAVALMAVAAAGAGAVFFGGDFLPTDAAKTSEVQLQSAPISTTASTTTATTSPEDEAGTDSAEGAPRFEVEGELPLTDEEVNDMLAFVEAETGRDFVRPPKIIAQSPEDFEAGLAENTAEELAEFNESVDIAARVYQALGLSDQGSEELAENVSAFFETGDVIAGYYDSEVDTLYVPVDPDAGQQFRVTLVHELTHALDDQYVDLFALGEYSSEHPEDSELNMALDMVIEGRASAVDERWSQRFGSEEDQEATEPTEEQLALFESVPPILLEAVALPYNLGPAFIERNGGPAETWDFYDNPPASSEQLLFPDTGLDEPIIDTIEPVSDGEELDRSDFGAADLLLMLIAGPSEASDRAVTEAVIAADGWAGGQMVLWGDETESCVRFALAGDTATDLAEITEVLSDWTEDENGRTVNTDAPDLVEVTACAPYKP